MGIELNRDQIELKRKLMQWYKDRDKQFFYYSGRAGTGKTTVVRAFVEELGLEPGEYICSAYTGKAVTVLLRKNYPACTIHSLIYDVIIKTVYRKAYDEENDVEYEVPKQIMQFELKEALPTMLKLIIIDECKMVPDAMIHHLLSFGIPIIFMGDENQLPPVMGSSRILASPDAVLNEIMRQAEDDPIVMIANWILDDMPLKYGNYGKSSIVEKIEFDKRVLTDYDLILCGKNKTRDNLNHTIRKEILKLNDNRLYLGEKLVCRQNNQDAYLDGIFLTNGMVGFVDNIEAHRSGSKYITIDFKPDFMNIPYEDIKVDRKYFYSPYEERNNYGLSRWNKFEYGYVLTTHLAQGSEAPNVLYIDELMHSNDITRRLRYTAVTRATNFITFVTSYGKKYFVF